MSEIPDINRTLFRIAKKLTSDNVEDIKLLYNDVIGERKLEEATDGKALLKLLKENNYLNTSEKVEKFCEDILIEIGREDIRNEILGKSCEEHNDIPDVKTKLKNGYNQGKIAKKNRRNTNLPTDLLEVVAHKLAGDWRRFARKLDHDEGLIEQVDLDFRKTYDKTFEILNRWLEQSEINVTWEMLKEKLVKLPRYDIVREIEKVFPEVVSSELVVELPRESSKESTTTAATAAVAHHLGNSLYKQSHTAEQTSESQEFLGNPNYALPGNIDSLGRIGDSNSDSTKTKNEEKDSTKTEDEEILADRLKDLQSR